MRYRYLMGVCGLVLPLLAVAGESAPTVYVQGGYRFGSTIESQDPKQELTKVDQEDGPAWGLLAQFPSDNDTALEVLASSGTSRVDVEGQPRLEVSHLLFGGIKYVERGEVNPFIGFALGLSYFRLDRHDDAFLPAWALYSGLEWPVGRHMMVRAEARWLGAYVGSDTTLHCRTGCSLSVRQGYWSGVEAMLGLGVHF